MYVYASMYVYGQNMLDWNVQDSFTFSNTVKVFNCCYELQEFNGQSAILGPTKLFLAATLEPAESQDTVGSSLGLSRPVTSLTMASPATRGQF